MLTLDPSLQTSGPYTSGTPAGYAQSVEILASGATPGVLEPGESIQVPVYYAGWLSGQWDSSNPAVTFSLTTLNADNTTSVDWSSVLASAQPQGVNAAAWSTISSNLQTQLGTSAGGYVQLLDNEASYLGTLGENVTDVQSLFGFALQQADNTLNPLAPFLTSATDDSVDTPGSLSLSFSRMFAESITGRDTMGPLGMGWTTSWQTSASIASDGTVTITEPGDAQRIFQPDSRTPGAYFSEPGDTGTLTADGNGGYLLTESDGIATDYNGNGTLNYMQDTDGNRITAGYTAGQLTSLTASSGQYIDIAYNAAGLISSITDSAGRTTTYNYDPTNTYLVSVNGFNGQSTNYSYDTTSGDPAQNALETITIPGGTHEYFTYDSLGRLAGISQDGGAEPETFTYSFGQVTMTDGTGDSSSTYYNENGLVAKTVDALGNPTYYSYDSNFNLIKITNAAGESETYTYNAAGEVTSSTDFLGNTTNFAYSGPFNELSSMTDANGNTTSYAYNSSGDLLSTTYADGSVSSSTFNPEGEATSFVNANGQPIDYTYNAAGQITQESFSDGSSYTYTYDSDGNMLTATDATGTTNFTYDPTTELLTEVAYPNGMYLKFTYNAAGQRTQMVDQTGFTVNYAYDADGRLSELTDGSGNMIVTYTYDADGRLSEKTNGNGTYTTYTYDKDGNVLDLVNYAPDGSINSSFIYTYNDLGLETSETTLDGTWTYSYDADGQLTHAVFASMNPSVPSQDLTYNYDAMGNRTSTVINGVTTLYTTNDMNEYTSVGGVAYTYDADGNLTSDGTNTYTYNSLDQLTAVTGPSGTTTYTYDALGQRIDATTNDNTTQYLIDPSGLGNVVSTYTGSGSVIADYTYGLGLTSEVMSQGSYYYDFDALGSTVDLTDSSGKIASSMSYLPFGQVTIGNPTVLNPFTFVGEAGVISDVSGNYYMRGREYNSQVGQFMSMDPIGIYGGDPNLRRYVTNSPLQFIDPSGLEEEPADWSGVIRDAVVEVNKTSFESTLYETFYNTQRDSALSDVVEAVRQGGGVIEADVPAYQRFEFVETTAKVAPNIIPGAAAFLSGVSIGNDLNKGKIGEAGFETGEFLLVTFVPEAGLPVLGLNTLIALNNQYHITSGLGAYINGGDCTLDVVGSAYYLCGGNQVYTQFLAPIGVPGRQCSAEELAGALSSALLNTLANLPVTKLLAGSTGPGEGGGISGFAGPATFATSIPPPSPEIKALCNQLINYLNQQLSTASANANRQTINLQPVQAGGQRILNSLPTGGSDPDPLPFLTIALGNLGLIAGQYGNSGFTASQAAQVVPTIAAYDQWEADIASIEATGANNSEVAGDMALLAKIGGYLQAITTAENALFGGDPNWLSTTQTATLQQWMTDFYEDVVGNGASGEMITPAEQAQLLATTLPAGVSTAEATEFIDRWNLTVQYWLAGIDTSAQVPAGQSTDFLDAGTLQTLFAAAENAELASQADGYTDPAAEYRAALVTVQNDLAGEGACATVQLQIDQSATLTRSAFSGTLSITNSEGTGAMTNVVMDINITDAEGNPANGEFFVSSPTYSGAFSVLNGNATLPDFSTGTITFTFIPDDSAAPSAPTIYNIGGTIGFTDPSGGAVTIPVFPSTITVDPQAQLQLNYFLQQSVFGDDSTATQDEPSEPAVLGMLVTNVGGGTANNLSITTAEPQIIENEKGLAENIQIIGTQVGTQQLPSPSLTVDLGNVEPGQTADADFLLESSLDGELEDFSATFTHTDALGGLETSLISSVQTHSLVHAGDFNYPDSTGEMDYLVNDIPNPENLPDTIYFSDGTTAPVNVATNATSSPVGPSGQLTFQVTANVTSGWDYIQIPDPGAGYTLYKVVRSDGTVIPVSDQAWTTDRTISSTGQSTVDDELHILDDNSTGSYMVYYRPTTLAPPAVASITQVTSPQSGPVSSVNVAFTEPINPSTFKAQNLTLTLNSGSNLINSSVTITQDSATTFTIGGLAALTAASGNYDLTVSASGVSDFFGDVGSGSESVTWATAINAPVIVSVGAGNPSLINTPVQTVDVVLSEPIDPTTFNDNALSLTLNGGPNLITPDVTITEVDATTYAIGGLAPLTAADGDYVLTVSAAGFIDEAGNSVPARSRKAGRSTRWGRPSHRFRASTSRRETSSSPRWTSRSPSRSTRPHSHTRTSHTPRKAAPTSSPPT